LHILKNNRLSIFFVLLLTGTLSAQFQGLKFMVNPGHGGHDSDDRYIPQTGYWESEGNLTKGLYLRDLLKDRGAQVIMSRTQNRTEDDLPLSDIDRIANENQVDFFHSIHSNASSGNANYTLMLYKEMNGQPAFPEAREMGGIMADKIHAVNYTTDARNKGDMSFLGFNLGVLRTLNMPGTLSEGSFHDYIPESWRLQNIAYRHHEAQAIMRSFLAYYHLPADTFGVIAGYERDKNHKVSNYISSLSQDQYKTINNLRAALYDSLDNILKVYNGDFNNNGFFYFDSLAEGLYKVIIDFGAFEPDTLSFTVSRGTSVIRHRKPAPQSGLPPQVFGMEPASGSTEIDPYASVRLTFSQSMDTQSVGAVTFSPQRTGEFAWSQSNQTLMFTPDSAWRLADTVYVLVDSSALNSEGVVMEQPFSGQFVTGSAYKRSYIKETYPSDGDSITIYKKIWLTFSQKMLARTVLHALDIQPAVSGQWLVKDDSTRFVFQPDSVWQRDQNYRLTVAPSALNTRQVGLADSVVLTFKTQRRNALYLRRHIPAVADTNVSYKTELWFEFDGIVNGFTARDHIRVTGPEGEVNLKFPTVFKYGDRSIMTLRPYKEWTHGGNYQVYVDQGLEDVDSLTLTDSIRFHFKIQSREIVSSTVLEDFSAGLPWLAPADHPLTQGVQDSLTLVLQSAQEKISPVFAMQLQYAFAGDSAGVVVLDRETPLIITGVDSSVWGAWVYGDGSLHHLAYRLIVAGDTLWRDMGPINWAGWRFTGLTMDSVAATGSFQWLGLALIQNDTSLTSGKLYFDDLQSEAVTFVDETPIGLPRATHLGYNYPNPFNPQTTIPYQLAAPARVELQVFDALGRRVYSWQARRQPAGIYRHVIRAADWASGVYFYRLKVLEKNKAPRYFTRKFLLLK